MIPLGLYRSTRVNLQAYKDLDNQKNAKKLRTAQGDGDIDDNGKDFKKIKYVVTNPDKDTRLEETDLVFVLAKQDPGDPEQWDEYNENNKSMFDQNQNRLMANINDMLLKPSGGLGNNGLKKGKKNQMGGNKYGQKATAEGDSQNNKNYYCSTMTNQANNPV